MDYTAAERMTVNAASLLRDGEVVSRGLLNLMRRAHVPDLLTVLAISMPPSSAIIVGQKCLCRVGWSDGNGSLSKLLLCDPPHQKWRFPQEVDFCTSGGLPGGHAGVRKAECADKVHWR